MSAGKLIKLFATRTEVPIDIDGDVIPAVQSLGFSGELYWFYAEMDSSVLRGSLVQWEYPASENGPMIQVAEITVADDQTEDWRRMIACKEMIHLLDKPGERVNTTEDFDRLIERLSLPADMQDFKQDGLQVLTDRMAVTEALAVLFPLAARNELYKPFKDGKLALADIARIVNIPQRYVALAMHESWESLYEFLTRGA